MEWEDTCANSGWRDLGLAKEETTISCISCGLILGEDDQKIIICTSLAKSGQYGEATTIPKGCIKRIRTLRVK